MLFFISGFIRWFLEVIFNVSEIEFRLILFCFLFYYWLRLSLFFCLLLLLIIHWWHIWLLFFLILSVSEIKSFWYKCRFFLLCLCFLLYKWILRYGKLLGWLLLLFNLIFGYLFILLIVPTLKFHHPRASKRWLLFLFLLWFLLLLII